MTFFCSFVSSIIKHISFIYGNGFRCFNESWKVFVRFFQCTTKSFSTLSTEVNDVYFIIARVIDDFNNFIDFQRTLHETDLQHTKIYSHSMIFNTIDANFIDYWNDVIITCHKIKYTTNYESGRCVVHSCQLSWLPISINISFVAAIKEKPMRRKLQFRIRYLNEKVVEMTELSQTLRISHFECKSTNCRQINGIIEYFTFFTSETSFKSNSFWC